MPTVIIRKNGATGGERGRSSSEGGVGSMTESSHGGERGADDADKAVKRQKKSRVRQQFSLNDELLSRDRLQANHEVRKQVRTVDLDLDLDVDLDLDLDLDLEVDVDVNMEVEVASSFTCLNWQFSEACYFCPFSDPEAAITAR
jgi:hypothetical protein